MIDTSIDIIEKNSIQIIANSLEWQQTNYPNRTYEVHKCAEDIESILKCYIADLRNNTTTNIEYVGTKFWKNKVRQLSSYDVEVAVHNYLVEYIVKNYDISIEIKNKLNNLKDQLITIIVNGTDNCIPIIDGMFSTFKTIRSFTDDPVTDEHIDAITSAALSAPSKNSIFPYRIVALTQSDDGKAAKRHFCRNVCITEWVINKDDQPSYEFDRTNITTPKIKMTMCLKQIEAPVTFLFISEFVADKNQKNNFFDLKENYDTYTLTEVLQMGHAELASRVIRDTMLAASWAQLKAQELGYSTSFVGNAGQLFNDNFTEDCKVKIKDNETCIIMLCVGNAAPNSNEHSDELRCVVEEINPIDQEITEVVFYERHRSGLLQHEARGFPIPNILKI